MRRGFAIMLVYLGLLAAVVALGLLFIPPIVSEVNDLADNAPRYAQDVQDYVQKNERLRKLEEDYDITQKLQDEAGKLPERVGGAAGTLQRRRLRHRQQPLRAGDDPGPDGVHARQRPPLGR